MIGSRARKRQIESLNFYTKWAIKLALFLVFISILCFLSAKFKTYFPIKNVNVYGVQRIDESLLQEMLTPLVDKGFFAIDVEYIKDQLLQDPWVSKATVQRVWPDQINITVIEKKPIARWNKSSLLTVNGELFNPEEHSFNSEMPNFIGPMGQHMKLLEYYKLINTILLPLQLKLVELELTSDQSWKLTLNSGIKMRAGKKDILTRMNHFVRVYPKIVGTRQSEVDYIDLRYPNGLAVKWKTTT